MPVQEQDHEEDQQPHRHQPVLQLLEICMLGHCRWKMKTELKHGIFTYEKVNFHLLTDPRKQ